MNILFILLAILVLLMMVTIHEFGHYCAGKLLGFKINEFSVGFGKSLYSKRAKSGEIFSLRLIPLGGYCAFEGEETQGDDKNSFMKQEPWKRLIVLFSGAFFNFLSAIIFCLILLVSVGYDIPQVYSVDQVVKIISTEQIDSETFELTDFAFLSSDKIVAIDGNEMLQVASSFLPTLLSDREEYTATGYTLTVLRNDVELSVLLTVELNNNYGTGLTTLLPDDVIIAVNDVKVDFIKDNYFQDLLRTAAVGDNVKLTVRRGGILQDLEINFYDSGFKKLDGTYAKAIGIRSTSYRFTFGEALIRCVPYTFGFSWKIMQALGNLITGKSGLSDIGGPIYIVGTIATLTATGISSFLILLVLIAVNLAVFNLLPFPALDGSKMVLTVVEWIRGKPLNQKVENAIHFIGLILLFALVIVADVYHLIFG